MSVQFETLLEDAPEGIDMLRFTCMSCGNGCLVKQVPTVCHPLCDEADWKLNKWQEGYIVGRDGFTHPKGEY